MKPVSQTSRPPILDQGEAGGSISFIRRSRRFIDSGCQRRRRLHDLMGLIIAVIAAASLFSGRNDDSAFDLTSSPEVNLVSYRPDGGQVVSPAGTMEPNLLTRLNGGRAIELSSANPGHLAHLPSLGFNSAVKAARSGCLGSRQKKTLDGLITESCYPNKP